MQQSSFELWWGRFVRMVAFLIGVGIASWETLHDGAQHPWAYGASIVFMGLPAARVAEALVQAIAKGMGEQTIRIEREGRAGPKDEEDR
jgi:hypothetical protein